MARAEFVLKPGFPHLSEGSQQGARALRGMEELDTFDTAEKAKLPTDFYASLFKATEKQEALPTWVDLDKQFARRELDGLPRIDIRSNKTST